jgi:hypothetical protein
LSIGVGKYLNSNYYHISVSWYERSLGIIHNEILVECVNFIPQENKQKYRCKCESCSNVIERTYCHQKRRQVKVCTELIEVINK